MKSLSLNDLFSIAGGAGECEIKDGSLTGKLNVPAHLEEQNLVVMIVLRDPLLQNFNEVNQVICNSL